MQVTLKLSDLSRALVAASIVPARPVTPVLGSVLLRAEGDRLWLAATDLEVSVRLAVPAEVHEPGEAAPPAKTLADLVRRLPASAGEVGLASSGGKLRAGYGAGAVELAGFAPEQFPAFPEEPDDPACFLVTGGELEELVAQLGPVTADQPPFSGVLCEVEEGRITWVATDTHRLAVKAGAEVDASFRAVFPLKALEAAARLAGEGVCEVRVDPGMAVMNMADAAVAARLIGMKYPDWKKAVPAEGGPVVTAGSKLLAAALERALLIARAAPKERANIVRLEFGAGGLVVAAESDVGSALEAVEAKLDGEPGRVYFNGAYLLEALRHLSGRDAVLRFVAGNRAAWVSGGPDADYRCLVLAVVVSGAAAEAA